MSFIIGFLLGAVGGFVAGFLVFRKNQAKINAVESETIAKVNEIKEVLK